MKKFLIFALMIFALGCAKKYVKAPEEPVSRPEKEAVTEKVQVVKEKITPPPAEEVTTSTTTAAAEKEAPFALKDVLFDYDKYNIRPDAKAALDSIAEWLSKNKGLNVLIEGHCDERGTNEYNLALGEKRANTAKDYLAAKGIASAKMRTMTYGEEKPVCTESGESCWQRNRRAHFAIAE